VRTVTHSILTAPALRFGVDDLLEMQRLLSCELSPAFISRPASGAIGVGFFMLMPSMGVRTAWTEIIGVISTSRTKADRSGTANRRPTDEGLFQRPCCFELGGIRF
jgi:hypothetical protein